LSKNEKNEKNEKLKQQSIEQKGFYLVKRVPGKAKRVSGKRQAEKGASLRAQVMDAAIDCLAEMPYSEISMEIIAKQAGVSRGGMQYHFPTRLDVLGATVEQLHRERLEIFRRDLEGIAPHVDAIDHIIDSHWKHLNEREFRAYQELILVARSEPQLADLLAASYAVFISRWHNIAEELMGWKAADPETARSGNIAHYLLEGMAYGKIGGQLSEKEIEEMLDYAKHIMRGQMRK
jgi:AcrR family transcriptional regulator